MPNHLENESSPYLLLHKENPVDWYPWGEEALARARREGLPIFLSVGYSTCYWCHVMERESFSNESIAALMNERFVNIKVDREERPDLDEIYMVATQLATGQGGWPNSVFLTPDLEPFYAGTYFPPVDAHGRPGFPTVLTSLSDAWRDRKEEVKEQAASLAAAIRRYLGERGEPLPTPPQPELAERSYLALERRFDSRYGGFGQAPKFPTPSNLFLLREMRGEHRRAEEMLARTLDRMARGGIYDQLGGGFHRYATDERWLVPHFEKMLYDNGLLLEAYAHRWRDVQDPEAARIARETVGFLAAEMTGPEGELWSALDAETDGMEGAYYVWTRGELQEVLDQEDFAFLAPLLGFDGSPFFEGEHYVLHLPVPLAEQASKRRTTREELLAEMEPLRERLLATRRERPAPNVDDKVLTDWSGLAIAGLATAGQCLGETPMLERAEAATEFILSRLRPAGELHHSWRDGRLGPLAFLSDYAYFVKGLLALAAGDEAERWLNLAVELTEEQISRLGDPLGGYFAAAESSELLARSKDIFDGATPSANGVAVLNLLELADATGERRWLEEADRALRALGGVATQQPEAARTMSLAARRRDRRAAEKGEEDPVAVQLSVDSAGEDGWAPFSLALSIAPGWHVATEDPASRYSRPTTLRGIGTDLRHLAFPPGRVLDDGPDAPLVWEGTVTIEGELKPDADPRIEISVQPCAGERCLLPTVLVAT